MAYRVHFILCSFMFSNSLIRLHIVVIDSKMFTLHVHIRNKTVKEMGKLSKLCQLQFKEIVMNRYSRAAHEYSKPTTA